MKNIESILGDSVRRLIKASKLKNKTCLAKRIKSNHKTVYDIYDGKGNPKLQTIDKIANALHVPTWTLLQDIIDTESINIKKVETLMHLVMSLTDGQLDDLTKELQIKCDYRKIKERLSKYEPDS